MAELPDFIPPEVAAGLERWLSNYSDQPDYQACQQRLIHRQCMEKVYRSLSRHLSGEDRWFRFLDGVLMASDLGDYLANHVRPAQRETPRKLKHIQDRGRKFLVALENMWGDEARDGHGYFPPYEYFCLLDLLRSVRMGAKGERLEELLYQPGEYATATRMAVAAFSIQDVIRAIVGASADWRPSPDDEWQEMHDSTKLNPRTVFVRAVDRMLREETYLADGQRTFPSPEALPDGLLLNYEDLARLTRAALDLPDRPGPGRKAFSGDNVRLALTPD